jgi:phage-related minor tail protein
MRTRPPGADDRPVTGLSLSLTVIVVFLALAATILLVGGTVSAWRVAAQVVARARERRASGSAARVATG